MKLTRRAVSLVLLALTSACVADAHSEDFSGLDDTRVFVDGPIEEVCDPSQQIAYGPGPMDCNGIGPWAGERLFGAGLLPSGLARYCRFTYAGAKQSHVDWLRNKLETTVGSGVQLGTDCRAVTPEGSATQTALAPDLDEYFDWYSGRVGPDEIAAAYPNAIANRVDVAVVDTAPHQFTGLPTSDHGPIVASLINSFVCPTGSSSCAIDVETFLGLPRTVEDHQPHPIKGGYLGLQSDLARGVFDALEDHRSSNADNLVINLSVAWEPEVFGGAEDVADLSPPVRAVYDALRVARCDGALLLAASGNSQGLSCSEGAMAPALWEQHPAPTTWECVSELGVGAPQADPATYAPLVHAVGGLRGDASKVPNGREFGTPKLGAASSHVLVAKGPGMAEDEVRTGTSMGTAVAAATASLVWSYHPTKSPSEVMELLYSSGKPTSFTSDFGLAGQQDAVKRISACRAVASSCANGACGKNPVGLSCAGPQPVGVWDLAESIALAPHTADQYTTEFAEPRECENACGETYLFYPSPDDERECTEVDRDPWDKLTAPQPIFGGCEECEVEFHAAGGATAELNIDQEYRNVPILAVDIELVDAVGEPKVIALSEREVAGGAVIQPRLDPDAIRQYELDLAIEGFEPVEAHVLITFDGRESTRDPLILVQ